MSDTQTETLSESDLQLTKKCMALIQKSASRGADSKDPWVIGFIFQELAWALGDYNIDAPLCDLADLPHETAEIDQEDHDIAAEDEPEEIRDEESESNPENLEELHASLVQLNVVLSKLAKWKKRRGIAF